MPTNAYVSLALSIKYADDMALFGLLNNLETLAEIQYLKASLSSKTDVSYDVRHLRYNCRQDKGDEGMLYSGD